MTISFAKRAPVQEASPAPSGEAPDPEGLARARHDAAQSDLASAPDRLAPTLEAAFEAHWSPVCATLYRLVGDWDEAEDLALEVFCRLHRRPPPDLERLGGWLYRVATNVGLNALRARQRRSRYEQIAGLLRLHSADPVDPAALVERDEAQERVRQVLAQIKPRSAQLLVLRHSGLSYADIADALNLAPGSVGTLLARAEKEFERRYRARGATVSRLEEGDEAF